MEDFEEKLKGISKPLIKELRHQEKLAKAILKARDKSAVSGWWISIPIYVIAAFLMKTIYMPRTSLVSSLEQWENDNKLISVILFLVLPFLILIINGISIRKMHFLSGSPMTIPFLKRVYVQLLMIIISILVLLIYLQ